MATIHPGEHLAQELKTIDLSAAELAQRKIDVPKNGVTQVLNGTRITAPRLCGSGISSVRAPRFWLNLQSLYDLQLAEQKSGKSIRALATLKGANPFTRKARKATPPSLPWKPSSHGKLSRERHPVKMSVVYCPRAGRKFSSSVCARSTF